MPKIKTKRDDILNEDEVVYTLNNCKNEEIQAAIALLWLTGCRIGEILILKLKDIKNANDFIELNTPTLKQRGDVIPRRRILLPKKSKFYPYIKNYINSIHPKYPDKIIFEMSRTTCWKMMKEANPDIYPHLFRHSRATILSESLDIFDLKYLFGWKSMDMPEKYIHRKNSPERAYTALSKEHESNSERKIKCESLESNKE